MKQLSKIVKSMMAICFVLFVITGMPVNASEVELNGSTTTDKAPEIQLGTEYVTRIYSKDTEYYFKFTTSDEDAFYFLRSYNISVPAHSSPTYSNLDFSIEDRYGQEYLETSHYRGADWLWDDGKLKQNYTYYVCIEAEQSGTYPGWVKFRVDKKVDDEADTMLTAEKISRDKKYTKSIETDDDYDYFKFTTGAEEKYELYGYNISSSGHTSVADKYLRFSVMTENEAVKGKVRVKKGEKDTETVVLEPYTTYYIAVKNHWPKHSEVRFTEDGKYTFSIGKPTILEDDVKLSKTSYTYNGKSQKPDVTVKHDGVTLTEGTDYKLTWSNTVNAGTGKVKVTGIGSYKGTVTKTYTIKQQSIYSSDVTVSSKKYTYNGSAIKAAVTVKNDEGEILTKGTDYKVTYSNNLKAGTGKVKVTAINNYKGEWTKSFTIHCQEIKSQNVKLSKTKFGHDGKTKSPKVIAYNNQGKKLVADTDFYVSNYGYSSVGRYKVTVNFRGNYSGSKEMWYVVVPKAPAKVYANLRTQKSGYDDVKVSWTAAEGASGYYVYYKTSSGKYKYLTERTSTTAYKDDLSDGVKYYFKVVPYYKASDGKKYTSLGSSSDYVYTLKKVNKPSVSKYSSSKVTIKWSNISGETGYEISRSTKENTKSVYKTVKSTSAKKLTFTTTKGKGYYYRVRAYKVVNNKKVYGPWSNAVYYKLK